MPCRTSEFAGGRGTAAPAFLTSWGHVQRLSYPGRRTTVAFHATPGSETYRGPGWHGVIVRKGYGLRTNFP